MTKTILLIEDDPDIVSILVDLLEASGYKAISSMSAEDGLALLTKEKPDLILLDLMLPKMSGADFAKSVKTNESLKNIPIVVISALRKEDQLKLGLGAYINDYIEKPFNPKDLMTSIKILLP